MTGDDDEFEDFLRRRKPAFRAPDDLFEPPAELDRAVLRQAREAIEGERPLRVFRGPRWAAPIALAATLVLAVAVVFHAGMPPKPAPVAEVTVENVAQRVEIPQAAQPMSPALSAAASRSPPEDAAEDGAIVVDLADPKLARREASRVLPDTAGNPVAHAPAEKPTDGGDGLVARDEAERYAVPPPPAPVVAGSAAERSTRERRMTGASVDAPPLVVTAPVAKSSEIPAWRRDAKTWLAEIERLRNAGDAVRADAELAEYRRQQRAYAVSPDR